MSKRTQTVEKEEAAGKMAKVYRAAAAAAAVFVIAVIALTAFAVRAQSDKQALRDQLTDAEKRLELREDALAALEAQQSEQKTIIQDLQDKVEELLNIQEADPVITSDQLQEQLNSVRELVTREYVYTNAARTEDNKVWLWGWPLPFSGSSLLVTYDGTIKAGIDLDRVKIDVNEDRRTITITLPPSEIISNEIPQGSINVLEVKDGLFNKVTFDDYNEFISAEQEAMAQKVTERGLLADADAEARTVIRSALNLLPGIDSYKLEIR